MYSFGILLLELLTGRFPGPGRGVSNLMRWVSSVIREEWTTEVFDEELLEQQKDGQEEEMMELLGLALDCCHRYETGRPTMSDVVQQIEEIRQSVLCTEF